MRLSDTCVLHFHAALLCVRHVPVGQARAEVGVPLDTLPQRVLEQLGIDWALQVSDIVDAPQPHRHRPLEEPFEPPHPPDLAVPGLRRRLAVVVPVRLRNQSWWEVVTSPRPKRMFRVVHKLL